MYRSIVSFSLNYTLRMAYSADLTSSRSELDLYIYDDSIRSAVELFTGGRVHRWVDAAKRLKFIFGVSTRSSRILHPCHPRSISSISLHLYRGKISTVAILHMVTAIIACIN